MKRSAMTFGLAAAAILLLGASPMRASSASLPTLTVYVSPKGNDAWTGLLAGPAKGARDGPLATLEAARDMIRAMKRAGKLPGGGAVVTLRDGVHTRLKPFLLSGDDSGTPIGPTVYRAYPGEHPRVVGGLEVRKWNPVTDPALLARLDPSAHGKIVCADMRALGITDFGEMRLRQLVERHGIETVRMRADEGRAYAEAAVRAVLTAAPDGDYAAVDLLDDDGQGNRDLPIRVTARIRGGHITFDFAGTAPETAGSVNATEAVTRSACYYVVRCLLEEEIPMNSGALAAIDVIAPEGTLVNAGAGRAVAAGNVETSQRIVDVLLEALRPAFPDRIPACSQGTMNNLLIGGTGFAYYETICGGAGASAQSPGAGAMHCHMTNTRNTPIEALEMHYPLRVREYRLREGSGGAGHHSGGDGVVRSIEMLQPSHVTLITERRVHPPCGAQRGSPGAAGRNVLVAPDGTVVELPGKFSAICEAGTIVTVETPGGGGWGPAENG